MFESLLEQFINKFLGTYI